MSKTTLFLIRHGQTDWNVAGRIQGHADIPLNATGIEQAQKVAQFLKKKNISLAALHSSDLQRAHQTAREIALQFALDVILATDLREGNFGKLEGTTRQERDELYGPMSDEEWPEKVGAEPRDKVIARVTNYLHRIVQAHKRQHIAVVTHGWLLHSLITHLGHNVSELPALSNVSITTITWHDDKQIFILESIEHA